MNFKKAYLLFEVVISIVISSFIIINSLYFQSFLLTEDKEKREIEISKLESLNTKMYLEKNLKKLSSLKYENKNLYFENSLLLKNVTYFSNFEENNIFIIEIILNNKLKHKWVIRK